MDLAIQNAIEKAKKQHLRSNLIGTIEALSEALELCSEEDSKLIYFEMATYYHQYHRSTDSFSMLLQAFDRGYSQEVIEKYILKHFINDKKYEENYNHNRDILSKYIYFKGEKLHNFELIEKYILFSDNSYTVFVTSDKKIIFDKNPEPDIQSCTEGTIFFLDNCKSLPHIFLLNKVSEKVNSRKSPFYMFFEQASDLESILTYIKLDSFLAARQALIFVGLEETAAYFSDLQSLLPTHVLNTVIAPINSETANPVLKKITDSRTQRVERAFEVIKQKYAGNQEALYSEVKNSNIKILFLSTRFDTRSSDIVMQYYASCSKLGYKCQSISEKSEISVSRDMEYIMIERFVPNIIFGVNTFRHDRPLYPKELIFLTYLKDTEGLDLADLLSHMTKNDFIFAGTAIYHILFRAGFPITNIIELPLIVDPLYEDKNPLRNLMYKCDVCIIADSTDAGAIASKIQSALLEKYPDKESEISSALSIIKTKYLTLFFSEQFILERKETEEMIAAAFVSSGINLDPGLLAYVAEEYSTSYCRSLYNTTIANWLLRSGFKNIKLWGKEWVNVPGFSEYSLGPILSEEILKRAISNSKIVIGSDLFEADTIGIYNAFQSGAMYLQNNILSKDQAIAAELGGKSDNGVQFFTGKQDFLNKVTYFCDNDPIRFEIVKKGKAFFTPETVCKKSLPNLISHIERFSDKQN